MRLFRSTRIWLVLANVLLLLGASSRVLEHAKFDTTVLLNEIPTPGHKVDFKH